MHKSDCSLHNAPAYVPGPCDCGANLGELPDLDIAAGTFADKHGSFVLQYEASETWKPDALPWCLYRVVDSVNSEADAWSGTTILEALIFADRELEKIDA